MKPEELSSYLKIAHEAAQAARKVHISFFNKLRDVRNKQDSSLVSEADEQSEAVIRDILRKKTPQFDILGEEEGSELSQGSSEAKSNGRWIFDPLDGTTNYIHGYPFFCSSIGLEINGQTVVGVVDAALFNKTYHASLGGGAFCNSQKITVSESPQLSSSLIATGFMTYGGVDLERQIRVFQKLIQTARGIRRCGAAALELCFLAEGSLDGFWEFGLKPWDMAAGSLIIKEAGGKITNDKNQDFRVDHKAIVASNVLIHSELISCLENS